MDAKDYPYPFMEWKTIHTSYNPKTGLYLYWEDKYTLEKLYEYWEKHIKDEI